MREVGGYDQLASLVRRDDQYERLDRELQASPNLTTRQRWSAFAKSDEMVQFDTKLRDTERAALAGATFTPAPFELAVLLRTASGRGDLSYAFVDATNQQVLDTAGQARHQAVADTLRTVAVAVAAMVATALAVVVTSRRIVRPLRALEGASLAVQHGELPDARLAVTGPREVAVSTDAFNGLVSALATLEDQAAALAAGELDSPVLDVVAPGRLAASIQQSVHRLQTSITTQTELHAQLAYQATHDTLTGMANRWAVTELLERNLASRADMVAVLVALDGFKTINEAVSHELADQALRTLGERLASAEGVPERLVARWGGDEFLVVAPAATAHHAMRIGERLVDAVSQPLTVGPISLRVGASAGVVHVDPSVRTVPAVLRAANAATRRAKARGRGVVRLFDDELRDELARVDELGVSLREALAEDQLELYFQPLVDPITGLVDEVEALIRWYPGGVEVAPSHFLPVAEDTGLSVDLDEWVLRAAAARVASWQHDPLLRHIAVAVNLSKASALSHGIAERVLELAWRAGAPPERLIIEVNEDTFVSSFASMGERLAALRQAGVRVAVDDFGTGLTSIGQLRAMPVDILKLDRSLVAVASETDAQVLRAVVDLGHALDLQIIAEGVETPEQAQVLVALQCHRLQGWLCAPAMAADLLPVWLAARALLPATSVELAGGPDRRT